MNFLEERIVKDGIVKEGNVLKVDSFLNHQMDITLFDEMGAEFKKRFADANINKILTIEASGIGIACIVARHFGVPVVGVEDGEVVVLGKAHGSKNGKNLLIQRTQSVGGIDFSRPFCLGYTGLSDRLIRKYIDDSHILWEKDCKKEELPVVSIGAAIGTHVGPGAIALAFFAS